MHIFAYPSIFTKVNAQTFLFKTNAKMVVIHMKTQDATLNYSASNLMGSIAGRGNSTLCGEFNFASDPDAAYVVLNDLNTHIMLFPWEVNLTNATGQPWVC